MDETREKSDTEIWCVVANIKRQHPYGPDGKDTKSGTRQFRGGTKVYIAGNHEGTLVAIGLHRKSRRFITCMAHINHFENFRVKQVFHPKVIRRICNDERCFRRTRQDAEDLMQAIPDWQKLYRRKDSTMDMDQDESSKKPDSVAEESIIAKYQSGKGCLWIGIAIVMVIGLILVAFFGR